MSTDLMTYVLENNLLEYLQKGGSPLQKREKYNKRMDSHIALKALENNVHYAKLKKNMDASVMIIDDNMLPADWEQLGEDAEINLEKIDKKNISFDDNGQNYKYSEENFNISEFDPFKQCIGTGFFVSENMIGSAAHNRIKESYYAIKGCYADANGNVKIKKKSIYKIKKVFNDEAGYTDMEGQREDWIFFEVEPLVNGMINTDIVTFAKQAVENGQDLYCIGHGLNLPLILSWNGMSFNVKSGYNSFYAKLETFYGNSGCPVFDAVTHELVGILSGQQSIPLIQVGERVYAHCVMLSGAYGAVCSHAHRLEKRFRQVYNITSKSKKPENPEEEVNQKGLAEILAAIFVLIYIALNI